MKKLLWGMVLIVLFSFEAYSQSIGDYRTTTTASGNWSTVTNWETYDGSTWVAATDYPGQNPGAGIVTIQADAAITLDLTPANSIGGLVIENGTNTELNLAGQTLTVTGDVTINGDIQSFPSVGGNLVIGGNLTINSTATFSSNYIDLVFNGSGTQTISGTATSPIPIGTLTINGTGTVDNNLNAPISIYNQLVLQSGIFLAGSTTYSFTNQTGGTIVFDKTGGTFTPETSTFKVTGNADLFMTVNEPVSFYNLYHEPVSVASNLYLDETAGTATTITIENELQLNPYSKGIILWSSNISIAYSTASLVYATSESITAGPEWPSTNGPDNVTISNGSVTLGSSRTVTGTLTLSGGDLTVSGDLSVGTLTINNANSDLSMSSNALTATTVNLSSGTLSVNALNINISGIFNYGAGTLTAASVSYGANSTLSYNANKTMGVEWVDNIPNVSVASGVTVSDVSATGDGTRNITGNLTLNGSGSVSFAAGNTDNLSIGGTLSVGTGTLAVQGGSVSVSSSVTVSGGSIVTNGGSLTSGDLLTNSGTINTSGGTGTITVSATGLNNTGTITTGTGGMAITGYVDNNGSITLNGNSSVSGNFTNQFNQTVDVGTATLTINGDLISEANSTFTGTGTVSLQGSFTSASGVSICSNGGIFEMNGSSNANVTIDNAVVLSTFLVNKTAGATVSVTANSGSQLRFVPNGTLHIQQGTLILSSTSQILDQNGGSISDDNLTLQIDANGRLNTGGTSITGFATYSLAAGSIVRFTGTDVSEVIPAATYGGIEVNNSSGLGVTLGGDITINDGLTLSGTSILYLSGKLITQNAATLTVNSGTILYTADAGGTVTGTDITGFASYSVSGTVVFNGTSGDETIPSGFNNQSCSIRVNKSSGNVVINGALTIGGAGHTLTLSKGLITFGTGGSLTLAAGTAVSGGDGSSYVDGTVSRIFDSSIEAGTVERVLPVGASGNYRPVRLDFTGLSGAVTITAVQNESAPSGTITATGVVDFATGLNRYWSLSSSGSGTFTSVNVDLVYTGTTDPSSALTIISGTQNDTWDTEGTSLTLPAADRIQATFTAFADFAIARKSQLVTWDGGGGDNNWSTAANWSGDVVPADGDNVQIDGAYTVSFDASATGTNFGSLTLANGATLSLDKGSTTLTFSSISVDGTSTLIFNGTALSIGSANTTYNGTVQYNSGTVYADTYTTLVINGASLSTSGDITATTLTVQASASLSAGNITASTLNLNGDLTVSGTGNVTTLSNVSGTTLSTSGTGAALNITNGFTNNGTISLSGNGTSSIPAVVNDGSITISGSGPVSFGAYSGNGTLDGSLGSGSVTFTSTFSPSGDVTFGSQTVNIQGNVSLNGGIFTPSTSTSFTATSFTFNGGSIGGTGTIAFEGSSQQSIAGTNASFINVKINNASGVALNTNVSVSGTLDLTNGIIDPGTNTLTLTETASVSNGNDNSYVLGTCRATLKSDNSAFFPVGRDGKYRPVGLSEVTGAGGSVFEFTVNNSTPPFNTNLESGLLKISSVRYWSGSIVSGSVSAYRIQLYYGSDDGVSNTQGLTTVRLNTSNNTWEDKGGTGTGAPTGSITSNSISATSLGDFTLGTTTADNSLPVELASFQAIGDYGKIILQWVTESEINNQGFYIYRAESEDGIYAKVNSAMIPGYQNSNERHEYIYEDKNVEEGKTYYYKLVSQDIDGKVNEYPTIVYAKAKILPKVFALYQNYPNPFNPTTTLRFDLPKDAVVSVVIYNSLGQEVKKIIDKQMLSAGHYESYKWDGTDNQGNPVSGGLYFVRMVAHDYNYQKTLKIIYLK